MNNAVVVFFRDGETELVKNIVDSSWMRNSFGELTNLQLVSMTKHGKVTYDFYGVDTTRFFLDASVLVFDDEENCIGYKITEVKYFESENE
jgi:hypothetical protein